jgi:hypothetical protein
MLRYRVWYTVLFKKHAIQIQYLHGNLPQLIVIQLSGFVFLMKVHNF